MKYPTTTNTDARSYVQSCTEFNGAKNDYSRNGYAISGRRVAHLYVVYSYGYWPMFLCDTRTDTWFINAHRYSATTSKHQSKCHPRGKDLMPLPIEELDRLIEQARLA